MEIKGVKIRGVETFLGLFFNPSRNSKTVRKNSNTEKNYSKNLDLQKKTSPSLEFEAEIGKKFTLKNLICE